MYMLIDPKIQSKYIIFLLTALLFSACEDIHRSSIPDAPVYLERNINSEAIELRIIGGHKTFTSADFGDAIGYGGIVIIHGFDEEFYAFDLACPHEVDREIKVEPNDAGQAVCPTCESVFSIGYGSGNRLSGPAEEGLKKYMVSSYEGVSGIIIRVTE